MFGAKRVSYQKFSIPTVTVLLLRAELKMVRAVLLRFEAVLAEVGRNFVGLAVKALIIYMYKEIHLDEGECLPQRGLGDGYSV